MKGCSIITKSLKFVFHDFACLLDSPYISEIAVHEVKAVSFNDPIRPAWLQPCYNYRVVCDRVR